MNLSDDEFRELVRLGPLVSIDLIVGDTSGRFLLGLRNNEPAKGTWFVPGGRIEKGKKLKDAFARIVERELGAEAYLDDATFRGVYEHFYDTNAFEQSGFGTHYVVLAYELAVDAAAIDALPRDQHSEWKWLTADEIIDAPEVHEHTKNYWR